jgi:hypothetical protein
MPGASQDDFAGALQEAARDADASFADVPLGPVLPCMRDRHWVALSLFVGDEPAAGARYRVTLSGGRVAEGALDGGGRARVERLAEGGSCTIAFPEVDAEAHGVAPTERPDEGATRPYTPGAPAEVALDASYRFELPGWELIALEDEGRAGDGQALGAGAGDDDDWELIELEQVDAAR